MSGRQRNIRKKALTSFEADEDEEQAGAGGFGLPPAAKAAQRVRNKQQKAEKKALLSFEDDAGGEDGGGPTAKPKSSKLKGIVRAPGAAAPPPADERAQRVYTQMSGAGEGHSGRGCQQLEAVWVCHGLDRSCCCRTQPSSNCGHRGCRVCALLPTCL